MPPGASQNLNSRYKNRPIGRRHVAKHNSVFGTTETSWKNLNLDARVKQSSESKEFNKNEGTKGDDDFGNFLRGDFLSDAENSFLKFRKTENLSCLPDVFVLGTSKSSTENPTLNMEMKQSNKSCSNLRKPESYSGMSNEFVFGTKMSDLGNPNLNMEMNKSNTSFSNLNSQGKGSNTNDESRNFLNGGYVFGAGKSYNLKNAESVFGLSNKFVFGTSESGSENPNLNMEMKQSNMNFFKSNSECKKSNKKYEFEEFLSGSFLSNARQDCSKLEKAESVSGLFNGVEFGTSESGSENPNLNMEMKQSNMNFFKSNSECKKSNKKYEFEEFLSGSFVSNARQDCSKLEKAESVSGLFNGVEFDSSEIGLRNPNVNVETKQFNTISSNSNSECNELNKDDELGRFSSRGFVFGTGNSSDLKKTGSVRRNPRRSCFVAKQQDSSSKKEESGEEMQNLTAETKGNAEVGSKTGNCFAFGFGENLGKFGSTLERTNSESYKNGENLIPVADEKVKSGARREVNSGTGSLSSSISASDLRKVFANSREIKADTELDFQKVKISDVFAFGSTIKGNLNKPSEKIIKPNTDNCRSSINNDIFGSDSFVDNKQKKLYRSSVSETCPMKMSTTDNFLDEMRKLSVDESEEKSKFGVIKESLNFCARSDPVFVFGTSSSAGSNTEQSGTTKTDDAKWQGPAKNDGVDAKITNESKSSNVGVSDEHMNFCFHKETFEEKSSTTTDQRIPNDTFVGTKSFSFQTGPGINSVGNGDKPNDATTLKNLPSQSLFSSGVFGVEGFSIGSTSAGSCGTGFMTPNRDASCSFAKKLSLGKDQYCSAGGRSNRDKKSKKLSHKFKKVDLTQQQPCKNNEGEGSLQNTESPGCYSPMDFSPYQSDQCTPSTTAASSGLARNEAAKEADTTNGGNFYVQAHKEFSKNFWESFAAEYPFEQAETAEGSSRTGQSSTNNKENYFPCSTESSEKDLGFSPISKEDNVSASVGRNIKKYRAKVGCGPNKIDPRCQVGNGYLHYSARNVKNDVEGDEKLIKQRSTTAGENACEKWKIRGNQAYEKGNSSKAEEYYTKGIVSFVQKGSSECSIEPLVLCYSNRAAARMLGGRMREAISDCLMAGSLDPSFKKAQLRAANCYLALGEIEEACQYFNECLESKGYICLDRRIAIEAASGLQKAQKLASCMSHCAELMRQKTSTAASSALENISAVLPTGSYSEKLLELKGEFLLMLQSYKEVIQLCEETLVSAEKNVVMVAGQNNSINVDVPNSSNSSILLWRWRLMSKSYIYLGRLELALDFLEKLEGLMASHDSSNTKDLLFPFAATVRELLRHKSAGNGAFQSGKHAEAVDHYSAAVSSSIESRPFAAVCFCNRAAAQQALGQLSDAISDCSIAIALDRSYSKALSRRATLHEKIRDYASASSDLQRLISLLKEQSQGKNCGSAGAKTSSGNIAEELRQAYKRLAFVEDKAKNGLPLDHYLILGVKSTDEASEMKKAYRRAALRHHPDKAGQFLARGDSGDDGRVWKDICEEIQKAADRLFKMIGEAYAVLSEPKKRSEYDLQEELRNARKDSNGYRDSTGPCHHGSSPFMNRRNNGRYYQESWKTYGYSRSRSQW